MKPSDAKEGVTFTVEMVLDCPVTEGETGAWGGGPLLFNFKNNIWWAHAKEDEKLRFWVLIDMI